MSFSNGKADVIIPADNFTLNNWRRFYAAVSDHVCVEVEADNPSEPITWGTPGSEVVILRHGDRFDPKQRTGADPVDGALIGVNPACPDGDPWFIASPGTDPQTLFDDGLLPLAIVKHDDYGHLDWLVFHRVYEPTPA